MLPKLTAKMFLASLEVYSSFQTLLVFSQRLQAAHLNLLGERGWKTEKNKMLSTDVKWVHTALEKKPEMFKPNQAILAAIVSND